MDPEDYANQYYDRLDREFAAQQRELRDKLSDQFGEGMIPIFADDVHVALDIPMDQLCFIDEDGTTLDVLDKTLGLTLKQIVRLERYIIDERGRGRDLR